MKLLVTGGAGFIGSNFINYWIEKYPTDQIINFDKLTYAGNLENLKRVESNQNYKFIKGDIVDVDSIDIAISEVDTVVHFAAESHVDKSIGSPCEFVFTNIIGTFNILESVKKHNKRLHHVSTDEVYGSLDLDSNRKFNIDSRYDPSSPYSASKASADHLVRSYFHTFNTQITISNCSNNYGPYQNLEKLIPLFITNLLAGKKVPVYGDGKNVRDWLFVLDHCKAIDLIIKNGVLGESYLIGGNNEISNIEITKMILSLMNKDDSLIEYVTDRLGHDKRYAIDASKIENELGWKPEMTFTEGLKATIAWYISNESWWKN